MATLKEYLEFIKLDIPVPVEPTLALLKQIIKAHLNAFSYQNTYLFIQGKKPVQERIIRTIDLDSNFDQMVSKKQPGYCFQNAELLSWALTELGFKVTKHLAKVVNCLSEKIDEKAISEGIESHELLIVDLPNEKNKKWIVDTGFANNSLREPLAIQNGEQKIRAENYRLTLAEKKIRLELAIPQGWFCLYDVDPQPKLQAEIYEANRQLFISDKPPAIVKFLKFGSVNDEKRKNLAHFPTTGPSFFKSLSLEKSKDTPIASAKDLCLLVEKKFAVTLDEDTQKALSF